MSISEEKRDRVFKEKEEARKLKEERTRREFLVINLFKYDCVLFGDIKFYSGKISPYRLALEQAQSNPALMHDLEKEYTSLLSESKFDFISGVPRSILPVSTVVARAMGKGMLTARIKEPLADGSITVDGFHQWMSGQEVMVVDDAATSGDSILKTVHALRRRGLVVNKAAVLLDRQEGASEALEENGIKLLSIFKANEFFDIARKARRFDGSGVIDNVSYERVQKYLSQNSQGKN